MAPAPLASSAHRARRSPWLGSRLPSALLFAAIGACGSPIAPEDGAADDTDGPDVTDTDSDGRDSEVVDTDTDGVDTDTDTPDTDTDTDTPDTDTDTDTDTDDTDTDTDTDDTDTDVVVPIDVVATCAAIDALSLSPEAPSTTDVLVARVVLPDPAAWRYVHVAWTADGAPTPEHALIVPAARTTKGETWAVRVTLDHPDGTCTASAEVTVANTRPTCATAVVTPEPVWAGDTVTCGCGGYADVDGDRAAPPACTWTTDDGTTIGLDCALPGSVVRAGDPLTCTLTPFDGEASGLPVEATVDPANAQPLLLGVTLVSDRFPLVYTGASNPALTCVADVVDLEGDLIHLAFDWLVNGEVVCETGPVPTGNLGDLGSDCLGRALVRGDLVSCQVRASDGVSTAPPTTRESALLVVGNTPPEVVSVSLADVRGDETMTCEPVFFDADGDVPFLQSVYTWRSAARGLLPATGRTLSTVGLVRGDTVTCAVRASDGIDVAEGTSNAATILNRLPVASGLRQGPTVGRSVDYNNLSCMGSGWTDGDGDPEAYDCEIWLDGVLKKSGRVSPSGVWLTVAYDEATWDIGQRIHLVATPWDGLEHGVPVTLDQEVVIGQPTACADVRVTPSSPTGAQDLTCACAQMANASNDGDPSNDRCSWWVAADIGVRSYASATWDWPVTQAFAGGCTLPAAQTPDGADVVCAYEAYDGRDVQGGHAFSPARRSGAVSVGPNATAPSFPTPGVTLSPAPDVSVTYNDDFRCDWNRTGVSHTGLVRYQVDWRVNGSSLGRLDAFADPAGNQQDGSIDRTLWHFALFAGIIRRTEPVPGDTVQCAVRVFDGRQATAWATSPVVTLRAALPGEVLKLQIAPADGIVPLETVTCAMEVQPGYTGAEILELRRSSDGSSGWQTVASASTTTDATLSTSYTPRAPSPSYFRCVARRDTGSGPVDVASSATIRFFQGTPSIPSIAVTPSSGDPCAPRSCTLSVAEPVRGPERGFTYDVSVQWSVSGVDRGAPITQVVHGGPTGTTLSVPMPDLGAGVGDTLACTAIVWKRGAVNGVGETSAPVAVTGTPPGLASAALPPYLRGDGVVTCSVTGATTTCVDPPAVAYTWTLDGEVVGHEASLDTSSLPAGGALVCTATPVTAGGLAGAPVTSGPSELLPGRWTIYGQQAGGYAGMSFDALDDVTGDGLPELIVGAPNMSFGPATSAGQLYLVEGTWAGGVTFLSDVANGDGGKSWRGDSGGWTMLDSWCNDAANTLCEPSAAGTSDSGAYWAPLGDGLGTRVRATGDLDGDGVADLLVSAPYALAHGEYLSGRTYQVSGAALLRPHYAIGQLQRDGGRLIDGAMGVDHLKTYRQTGSTTWVLEPRHDGHLAGFGLAAVDLDGDGYPDPVVGAPNAEGDLDVGAGAASNAGTTWVVPGGPGQGDVWLGDVGTSGLGAAFVGVDIDRSAHPWAPVSSQIGRHLANVGDMDGDGDDELLVGHTGAFGWDGGWWNTTYVVLGGELVGAHLREPSARIRRVAAPGASFGQSWTVPDAVYAGKTDWFGMASGAGDVNGDGLADLVVPFTEREGGVAQAEVAVFFGSRTATGDFDVEGPDRGVGGFVVEGKPVEGHYSLLVAAGLGDVDGDGLDDIGIAYVASGPGGPAGTRLAIVYGRTGTTPLTWADLESGLAGTVIDLGGDDMPTELVGADVDGDGLADAIVGRPYYDDPFLGDDVGRVDVWYGRDLRGKVERYGTRGPDAFGSAATTGAMVGGPGKDLVASYSDGAVLLGGSDDDTLASGRAPRRVRGGSGYDRLWLDPALTELDLRALRGRFEGIEWLDLGGRSIRLTLGVADVLRLPDLDRTLKVSGQSRSTLVLPEDGWVADGSAPTGERVLRHGAATLRIGGDLVVEVAPELDVGVPLVDENSPVGTYVTTITATDFGGGLVDVTVDADPWFHFDRVTGDLTVAQLGLDHELLPGFDIRIRAVGPTGLVTERSTVVEILDVPEAPWFVGRTGRTSVPEYADYDTTVAQLAAEDLDVDDALTFAWVSEDHAGAPGRAFDVDPISGRVYVVDGSWLDFETASTVEIGVEVRDRFGLTDQRTIVVDLLDRNTIAQVFTIPFFSEDQFLVDPDSEEGSLVLGAFDDVQDATTSPADASTEINDLAAGDQLKLSTSLSGSIARNVSLTVDPPKASVYLPVGISLEFPDDVVLGEAFTPTTDWTLQDDAVFYGNTTGLDLAVQLNLAGVGMEMFAQTPSAIEKVDPIYANGTFHLGIDPLPLTGAKMSLLDPDGFPVDDSSFETDCFVTKDMCPKLPIERQPPDGQGVNATDFTNDEWERYCPGVPYVPSMRRCDVLKPEKLVDLGYNALFKDRAEVGERFYGDDIIVAPAMTNRLLRIPTDPLLILSNLGLPQLTKLWGTVTVPVPGVGYHQLKYAIYKAPNIVVIDSHELYAAEAVGLIGTLTFEGGTTLSADLREGFGDVVLPLDEDVDGDGRVTFTLDLDLDVTLYRVWIWNLSLLWPAELLGLDIKSVLYERDLSGNVTGERLVGGDHWGPVYKSKWLIDVGARRFKDDWAATGFEGFSFDGALQLTRRP